MNVALWIIAICEIIRAAQNFLQIAITERDAASRGNVYSEFIQSLKQDDSEFVRRMLEEYEMGSNSGWISDDIAFCPVQCERKTCMRNKANIRVKDIPHSFSVEIPEDCPKKKAKQSDKT